MRRQGPTPLSIGKRFCNPGIACPDIAACTIDFGLPKKDEGRKKATKQKVTKQRDRSLLCHTNQTITGIVDVTNITNIPGIYIITGIPDYPALPRRIRFARSFSRSFSLSGRAAISPADSKSISRASCMASFCV